MNSLRNRRILLELVYAAIGAWAVFILPWSFSVDGPSTSLAYLYGFNTKVAWIAVALLLTVSFGLKWWMRSEVTAWETRLQEILVGPVSSKRDRGLLAAFAISSVAIIGVLMCFYAILPYTGYAEMDYFIPRFHLAAMGYEPFTDFQFTYSPAMLYPTAFLYRLAGGQLSMGTAYAVTLAAHWLAGLALLYHLVKGLGGAVKKTTVFLCLAVGALNFSMGINYTPLRFLLPLSCLVFFHRWITRREPARSVAVPLILSALLPLMCLSVSPEMGIMAVISFIAYFGMYFFSERRELAWGALGAACAIPLAHLTFGEGFFEGMQGSGSGSLNFPIFPTEHVLFLFLAVFAILPVTGVIGFRLGGAPRSFLCALVVLLGLSIPPALGRCDCGHIFFNGLGVIMLLLAAVTTSPNRVLRWGVVIAYLLIFPVADLFSFWGFSRGPVVNALVFRARIVGAPREELSIEPTLANAGRLMAKIWQYHGTPDAGPVFEKVPLRGPDLRELPPNIPVGAPFGMDLATTETLRNTNRYFVEFATRPAMPTNVPELQRKLSDLSRMNLILLPSGVFGEVPHSTPEFRRNKDSRWLSSLLVFPVSLPPPKREPFVSEVLVLKQIKEDFSVVKQLGDLVLLKRTKPAVADGVVP